MQYDFLQLVISSPFIHALGDPSQAPPGFEPVWEADDLPAELSLPPQDNILLKSKSFIRHYPGRWQQQILCLVKIKGKFIQCF